jgi:hypothetical protein
MTDSPAASRACARATRTASACRRSSLCLRPLPPLRQPAPSAHHQGTSVRCCGHPPGLRPRPAYRWRLLGPRWRAPEGRRVVVRRGHPRAGRGRCRERDRQRPHVRRRWLGRCYQRRQRFPPRCRVRWAEGTPASDQGRDAAVQGPVGQSRPPRQLSCRLPPTARVSDHRPDQTLLYWVLGLMSGGDTCRTASRSSR